MASIELDDDVQIGVAGSVVYTGTFDGGNKTISNASAPLFAAVNGATIKNLTISGAVTSDTVTGGIVDTITASDNATTFGNVISSVIVTIGGVESNYAYGFVGTYDDQTTAPTFTNCQDTTVDAENTFSSDDLAAVTVTDVAQNTAGTEIVVTWGIPASTNKYNYVVVTYTYNDGSDHTKATTPVLASEGTVSFDATADIEYIISVKTINVAGSTTSTDGADVPVSSWKVVPEAPSYDIVLVEDTYEIYTAEGLLAFAAIVNGTEYSGATTKDSDSVESVAFTVTADSKDASAKGKVVASITLTTGTWTPMVAYAGTFNGKYLAISGLTGAQGLFESIASGALVSNVTLTEPVISTDASDATVGAIAGTLASGATITGCLVEGGSVTVSGTGAVAGALVGTNAGEITNSTISCSVTIGGNLYNGGADDWFVGAGTAAEASCTDNYAGENGAAALAEAATIASAVPEYENATDGSTVTLTYTAKGDNVASAKLYVKEGTGDYTLSTEAVNIEDEESTITLKNLTADETYSFYVATYNYRGTETQSETATATTFNTDTYKDSTLPTITATTDGDGEAIVLTWETDALPIGLQSIEVVYGLGNSETIDATTIAAGTYTMDATYDTQTTKIATYNGYFAPSASTTNMVKKIGLSIDISINSYDIKEVSAGNYEIYNEEGLMAFASIVNGVENTEDDDADNVTYTTEPDSDANATVKGNIDLSGKTWVPMTAYAGTFDGGNGVTAETDADVTPTGYAITGLTGSNALFASTTSAAKITNVSLTATITSAGTNMGVLIGTSGVTGTACGTVEYTRVYGTLTGSGGGVAGIAGSSGGVTMNYVNNYVAVTGGGTAAGFFNSRNGSIILNNCENHGMISGTQGGGFGIYWQGSGNGVDAGTCTLTSCANHGYISMSSKEAAGFVGSVRDASFIDCHNHGTVSCTGTGSSVGGIVGTANAATVNITGCSNNAIVHSAGGTNVGGILGVNTAATVLNGAYGEDVLNYNNGWVNNTSSSNSSTIGGIVGALASSGTLSNYTNTGKVTTGATFSDNGGSSDCSTHTLTDGTSENSTNGIYGTNDGSVTNCFDSTVTAAGVINVTEVVVDGTSVTITWTTADNIDDVILYYKVSEDSTYSETILAADATSTTLTLATGTYSIYFATSNISGVTAATANEGVTTEFSGELSSTNPLTVTTSGIVAVDATYYATAYSDSDVSYAANTFAIHTPKGLAAFADVVNSGSNSTFANIEQYDAGGNTTYSFAKDPSANAVLTTSVDMTGYTSSIGSTSAEYKGTFDGGNGLDESTALENKGPAIENDDTSAIKITGLTAPLFGDAASGAVIKNVTLETAITGGGTSTAALISTSGTAIAAVADIKFCRVYGSVSGAANTSGFVGSSNGVNVSYSQNYASVNGGSNTHVAGFVSATTTASITIDNCENYGYVYGKSASGFVAYSTYAISNSINYGYIYATGNETAGFVNSSNSGTLTNCINKGTINASGDKVGGLVGTAYKGATLTNCSNEGIVHNRNTGDVSTGGLVGLTNNNATFVGTNTNSGSVNIMTTSSPSSVAGIAGSGTYTGEATNTGTVTYGGTFSDGGTTTTCTDDTITGGTTL